jgi:hypothetical protein
LRLLVLARDLDAGRKVLDADGRVRRVDALAAGPARAVDVYAQVVRIDLDIDLFGFRKDEDGRPPCPSRRRSLP